VRHSLRRYLARLCHAFLSSIYNSTAVNLQTNARCAATSCFGGNGARQHALPGVATESRAQAERPPAFAHVFRSLAAPGSNFFSVKASFWLPRSSILGEAVEQTFPTESSKLGRLMLTIGTSCDPDDVPRAAPHSVGADPKLFHVEAGLA
jgi:hypothetical protein